jgi:hypothetical protein
MLAGISSGKEGWGNDGLQDLLELLPKQLPKSMMRAQSSLA